MRTTACPSLLERWHALGRPLAKLSPRGAALLLVLLAAAMAWAAIANLPGTPSAPSPVSAASEGAPDPAGPRAAVTGRGEGDMALHARIARRVSGGEDYHAAALAEHRASGYPARPFVTVRLPTLAWLQALIGIDGVRWAALGLVAACLWALDARLAPLATPAERLGAAVLLMLGGGAAISPVAGLDHDFVAGLLLTLALLAWRPDRWGLALLAASAALAVRELAAPFVLLWLVFALLQHRWREAAALAGLLALFAGGMAFHALAVEAQRLPGDLASQGWNARAGYSLPLAALREHSGLRFLPAPLAAPLAILPLLGWVGLGGRIGLFASLWFAGVATLMALFARPANAYWVELALPAYMIGLALAPRALADLWGRVARQT